MHRLTKLYIENFKAFGSGQHIPLAPITLVYGPNSEGKSALLEALLLMAQSLQYPQSWQVLMVNGSLVSLRHFHTLIHQHNLSLPLKLGVFLQLDSGSSKDSLQSVLARHDTEVGMVWEFQWDNTHEVILHRKTDIYMGDAVNPLLRIHAPDSPVRTVQSSGDHHTGRMHKLILPPAAHFDPEVPKTWVAEQHGTIPLTRFRLWQSLTERALNKWKPVVEELQRWVNLIHTNPTLAAKNFRNLVEHYQGDIYEPFLEDRAAIFELGNPETMKSFAKVLRDSIDILSDPDPVHHLTWWEQYFSLYEAGDPWELRRKNQFLWSPDFSDLWYHFRSAIGTNYNIPPWGGAFLRILLSDWEYRMKMQKSQNEAQNEGLLWNDGEVLFELMNPKDLVDTLNGAVETIASHISFIGPMRQRFSSIVTNAEEDAVSVGLSGERTIEILRRHPDKLDELNEVLMQMGINYTLRIEPVSDTDLSMLSKVILHDNILDSDVAMDQLGYGISQILPIITEILAVDQKIVLVQQPELHIHPRLQAELGSIFAKGIAHNQYIIETHSENLLLRLRRLIRIGQFSPESVSVIYVQKTPEGSQCSAIRLDQQGNFLDPWPSGFFEEGFDELFGGNL